MDQDGKKYKCKVCGYVYDPAKGDPGNGINPGTPFADLPEDWLCPVCGAPKSAFESEGLDDMLIARQLNQIIESEEF